MSVKDGTLSQWSRRSRVCQGYKKNVSNVNLTATAMQFSMAPMSVEDGTLSRWPILSRVCRAWDFVTMGKIMCLSSMGLCHDGQEDPVPVKDGTLSMAKLMPCLLRMVLCHNAKKIPCLSRIEEKC